MTGILGEKDQRMLPIGLKPATFGLLEHLKDLSEARDYKLFITSCRKVTVAFNSLWEHSEFFLSKYARVIH